MHTQVYTPVWREKFQVRSSDIGYHGIMRVSNLCSYFQEVAGRHAEHLNVGYTQYAIDGYGMGAFKARHRNKKISCLG